MKILRFWKKWNMSRLVLIMMAIILFGSCKSEYDKLVRKELALGVKKDSLIFGIFMGETRKDFYTKCWELNKQKLVSEGSGNQTVKYLEQMDSLEDPTMRKEMQFYATFDEEDIIRGMDMSYSFTTWSPWKTERHSSVLLDLLVKEYQNVYGGNEFIPIEIDNSKYKAFVKVDGNRQILMYPLNDKDVKVKIEDLNYKLKQI